MELSHAVLVLAVSLAVVGTAVAVAVARAGRRIAQAAADTLVTVLDRGVGPQIDYPAFDEALAALHLQQAEEIHYGGQLTLEFEPEPVDAY